MTKKPKFEDQLKSLEQIVKELESDIPLDEAMKKYEQGMKLSGECQKELQVVEEKIMKLVDNKAEPETKPEAIPIEEHEFPTLF